MKKMILTLALTALSTAAFADWTWADYYPTGFAEKIHGKVIKDDALKTELFKVLTMSHQRTPDTNDTLVASCERAECYQQAVLGYKKAREFLFGLLDLKRDDRGYFLKDVYCEKDFVRSDIGPLKIPNNEIINCEHTWPQSKFSKAFNNEMQKSDLQHLYVTSSKANSTRGNNPFGEVQQGQAPESDCSASSVGVISGSTYFEPPVNHRGNVARALFYFSVRYKLTIDPTQEKFLRLWDKQDPPTDEDRKRNDQIQELQGNRNPFVDYPEMVDLISDF